MEGFENQGSFELCRNRLFTTSAARLIAHIISIGIKPEYLIRFQILQSLPDFSGTPFFCVQQANDLWQF